MVRKTMQRRKLEVNHRLDKQGKIYFGKYSMQYFEQIPDDYMEWVYRETNFHYNYPNLNNYLKNKFGGRYYAN